MANIGFSINQDYEDKLFAPYAVKSRMSRLRKYPEEEHPYRGIYQRDRDRIIHSTAFRRLEYKTQVFVNHEGDHYRTRLTHTLEVAQIGRSIARALRLNEDLVEAIALAHDLGHTPFGHSGEEILHVIMREHGGFDHNLQGLRVVDYLEERYPNFRGLNLTWEVREGILKHTTRFDYAGKINATENIKKTNIPSHYAGIDLTDLEPAMPPSLEAQIVDIADEIAYDNHDLDDGLNSRLLDIKEIQKIELWERANKLIKERNPNLESKIEKIQTIRNIIDLQVSDVIKNSDKIIKEINIKTLADVRSRSQRIIGFSKDMELARQPMRDYLMKNLYNHYRVIRMAEKARRFIEELFNVYIKRMEQLPPTSRKRLATEDPYRVVCDYIAGMTDRYALEEYKKLFDPFEKV
ncbi:MAG: deoxyguanosinetriphosphate triphosphohydrolase [Candidatus Omnitrophica bacterium]|nr:deoxyguanosinetriphosphate triphosphohydrolase [Candidatus Omnitrophota bacterium]